MAENGSESSWMENKMPERCFILLCITRPNLGWIGNNAEGCPSTDPGWRFFFHYFFTFWFGIRGSGVYHFRSLRGRRIGSRVAESEGAAQGAQQSGKAKENRSQSTMTRPSFTFSHSHTFFTVFDLGSWMHPEQEPYTHTRLLFSLLSQPHPCLIHINYLWPPSIVYLSLPWVWDFFFFLFLPCLFLNNSLIYFYFVVPKASS